MYCRELPSEDAPTYLILSSNSTKSFRPRSGQRGSEGHLRNGFPGAAPCRVGPAFADSASESLISGRFVMSWLKEATDAGRLCTAGPGGCFRVLAFLDTHCKPVRVQQVVSDTEGTVNESPTV